MGNTASQQQVSEEQYFQASQPPQEGLTAPGALTTADGQLRDPDHQPAEQQLVPTVLQWSHGGSTVHVTGSFNHWGERIPLRRSGAEFVVCLNLVPGTYQFKFIVDNEWRYATDQQTVRDQMGNVNNCVTVEDQAIYLHEDPASGFFSDGAVANAYTQRLPDEITLAKEPPLAPPHLAMLPLNLPSSPEPRIASWTLLPPASVTLQHMVTQRERTPEGATILSCTHRFRTKFVTIVIHKPSAALLLAQSGMGGMAQPGMQSMDAPQAMDLSSRPGSHQAYMDSYGGGAGPMQLPDGFGGCSHAMGGVPPAFGQPGAGGHVPMEGMGGVQGSNVFGQPPAGHVPFGGSPPVFGIMPPGAVFDPTGAQQQQHGDCGAAGGNGNRNDVVM